MRDGAENEVAKKPCKQACRGHEIVLHASTRKLPTSQGVQAPSQGHSNPWLGQQLARRAPATQQLVKSSHVRPCQERPLYCTWRRKGSPHSLRSLRVRGRAGSHMAPRTSRKGTSNTTALHSPGSRVSAAPTDKPPVVWTWSRMCDAKGGLDEGKWMQRRRERLQLLQEGVTTVWNSKEATVRKEA